MKSVKTPCLFTSVIILLTLIFCVPSLSAEDHASQTTDLPKWVLNPPFSDDSVYGIGSGETMFWSIIGAISDAGAQIETSLMLLPGEWYGGIQSSAFRGTCFFVTTGYFSFLMGKEETPTSHYTEQVFVRDPVTTDAAMFTRITREDESGMTEVIIYKDGSLTEDEALAMIKLYGGRMEAVPQENTNNYKALPVRIETIEEGTWQGETYYWSLVSVAGVLGSN